MPTADTTERQAAVKRAYEQAQRSMRNAPSIARMRAGEPGKTVTRKKGTSSGPMTLPRGTGGNGPMGRNTGT